MRGGRRTLSFGLLLGLVPKVAAHLLLALRYTSPLIADVDFIVFRGTRCHGSQLSLLRSRRRPCKPWGARPGQCRKLGNGPRRSQVHVMDHTYQPDSLLPQETRDWAPLAQRQRGLKGPATSTSVAAQCFCTQRHLRTSVLCGHVSEATLDECPVLRPPWPFEASERGQSAIRGSESRMPLPARARGPGRCTDAGALISGTSTGVCTSWCHQVRTARPTHSSMSATAFSVKPALAQRVSRARVVCRAAREMWCVPFARCCCSTPRCLPRPCGASPSARFCRYPGAAAPAHLDGSLGAFYATLRLKFVSLSRLRLGCGADGARSGEWLASRARVLSTGAPQQ